MGGKYLGAYIIWLVKDVGPRELARGPDSRFVVTLLGYRGMDKHVDKGG